MAGIEQALTFKDPAGHAVSGILTSPSHDSDRLAVYSRGANSFVSKPVKFDEFQRAVKQLKLYWLLLNEPPV